MLTKGQRICAIFWQRTVTLSTRKSTGRLLCLGIICMLMDGTCLYVVGAKMEPIHVSDVCCHCVCTPDRPSTSPIPYVQRPASTGTTCIHRPRPPGERGRTPPALTRPTAHTTSRLSWIIEGAWEVRQRVPILSRFSVGCFFATYAHV